MSSFRYGHASAPEWRAASEDCLAQLGPQDSESTLGFLYVTDGFAEEIPDIVAFFRARTSVPHWVGTVGIGICSTGIEYFDQPALAVMVTDLPASAFRVFSCAASDFEAFDQQHGTWCDTSHPYFGCVHGDPNNNAIPDLVGQLSRRMGEGYLVGGLSSSRGSYSQIADTISEGGLSGALFSPAVAVSTRLSQGCTPIGPRHEITACERNLLIEINGRPALDVFNEDIGEVLARDLKKAAGYIFAGLPIRGSDTGDYIVRNLVGIDPTNKVVAIGEIVSPGDTVMFCRRDAPSAREDLARMLTQLKDSIDKPPKGGVYYTCLARGPNLFGTNSEELKLIEATLGKFPLVGFFANGEICHDRLYGYTGVLTLFT